MNLKPDSQSVIISSPPLTLLVGRPPKSFFVHPGIIETLPFSSSTLDLEQMDGTHKTINLPKEDPEVFAALIEYLTTGKYTYHENADNDITPNLAQVLFHLNLYATAIRYDCKDLARNVLKIVNDVLVGLGAIDSLTAWKAAYLHACGLSMANFEASEAGHAMLTKLNKLGNHYTHRLVKLTEECPALAGDLLVFLAQNVETEAGGNEEEMEE
ncbi:hypothetical protein DFH27DRAFT_616081 [Peziza echinospora]|nr:hypothetical protein DFH27DRAFT_616081 [Peziza echinospora]